MYLKDWTGRWAMYQPEKLVANEFETGRSLTWQQLERQACAASRWLTEELGLGSGDRLAVLADFCLEYLVLLAVAQKTGITLVPLNYRLSGRELDYLLSDAGPKAMMVSENYSQLVEDQPCFGEVPHRFGLQSFQKLLQSARLSGSRPFEAKELPDSHPLFILYTSGTTGFPKGAIYTHQMAFWNSVNTASRLDITSGDHTIICMPPFHTGGWNVFITPFLHHGASVTLMKKFEPEKVLWLLEEQQATIFMAVPTMLKMMADEPAFGQVHLEKMRYFIVGGEAMPIPLIERWHEKGVPIRQGFGMTEAGPNLFSLHQRDAIRKKGSIGTPNFYVETRLVNEDGQEVPTGETGELQIRGPVVTPGYWQKPEATASSFANGWFCSGDLLKKDEEGYYFVMDRKKNMFISGGENVYPAEVEHFLRTHPCVMDVAVIGVPHPKWGEVGKAFVVLREGTMASTNEILEFCTGKLAKFKIPKHIEFINELPKNHTGKIDRKRLG